MVAFENLKVGSRVQTFKNGEIFTGIVRYKGGLITKQGDWVGVELDIPGGYTSGLYKGHRYFECHAKRGIFIRPTKLYLVGNWMSTSKNIYRSINKDSYVDETLFGKRQTAQPANEKCQFYKTCAFVTPEFKNSMSRSFSVPLSLQSYLERKTSFHKKHAVGRSKMPSTSKQFLYGDVRLAHDIRRSSGTTFIPSSPSIPNCHVPHKVYKRMVERHDFGTSLPRQNTSF